MQRLSKQEVLLLSSSTGDASNCDLSGVRLANLELLGMCFDGSLFTGADLSSSNLSGSIRWNGMLRPMRFLYYFSAREC